MLDQARSAQGKRDPQLSATFALRWSSMISHLEQRSSRRESRGWFFFFLSRVVVYSYTLKLLGKKKKKQLAKMCGVVWVKRHNLKKTCKAARRRSTHSTDMFFADFLKYMYLLLVLPWRKKKKNHPRDSRREEHCSIVRYHARWRTISTGQKSRTVADGRLCPALIVRHRAWYHKIEQHSSRRESRGWFFFFFFVQDGSMI